MRNIVMSDTGGWLPQLLNTFDKLGINAEEGTIPEDIRVIHCGDIIHKGPFSSQLLYIITNLMLNNPGQWIQLMGNHEAQHIPGAPTFWHCDCTPNDVGLLQALRREGMMNPTFGLNDEAIFTPPFGLQVPERKTSIFFSHGGLTAGFWDWKTEGEVNVEEVSRKLNELPIAEVTAPGLMLGENVPPRSVGPVWAIGNTEVFNSWRELEGQDMPFAQFHGHTTSYSFDYRKWWQGLHTFQQTAVLIPAKRTVASALNNNLMLGVDPGFNEREPRIPYQTWFEFETEK